MLLETAGQLLPAWEARGIELNKPVADLAGAVAEIGATPMSVSVGDTFELWSHGSLPQVDAVVANPPFGAVASSVDRTDPKIPEPLRRMRSIPAELLGLEVCLDTLKPGGILGIVLPQSVITNSSWSAYRAHVFSRLACVALVSLPEATFAPFQGVARAACVLVGNRVQAALPQRFPYARSKSVGYDDVGRTASEPSDLGLELLEGAKSGSCGRGWCCAAARTGIEW